MRKQSDSYPVSIAAGAGIGVETGDDFHTLLFVPNVVVSHAFFSGDSTGTGSGGISPYVGIGLSFTSFDIGTEHDGEFAVPIRAGADMRFNSQLGLVLEMQLYLGGNLNNHFGWAGASTYPSDPARPERGDTPFAHQIASPSALSLFDLREFRSTSKRVLVPTVLGC